MQKKLMLDETHEVKIEESKQSHHSSLGLKVEVIPQNNSLRVVILQHPQEPDKILGTATLCVRALKNAKLKVGLSWRNHKLVLGEGEVPGDWGVLYLGGQNKKFLDEVNLVNKKMELLTPRPHLKGIVVIDGTWSQAKALWWRNAWLLKLKRVVLQPKKPSLYGKLRKEPRRECLSTIESVALCLRELDADPTIADKLENYFSEMLKLY